MQQESFTSGAVSHAQPRFVRHQADSSHAEDKPRFILRAKSNSPLYLLDRLLMALHLRRNKRTRSCVAFALVALIAFLFFTFLLSLGRPLTFSSLTSTPSNVLPFNSSAHSFVDNPPHEQHHLPAGESIDDPGAPLDADQPDLQHRHQPAEEENPETQHPPAQAQAQDPEPDVGRQPDEGTGSSSSSQQSSLSSSDMQAIREEHGAANMSIVVLFHNEYDSLKYALKSWAKNGLIDYAQEVLFFLNGVPSEDYFVKSVPDLDNYVPEGKRRLVNSPKNLPLGLAITSMVEQAKHEYILLLEKDWELVEPKETMISRLTDSKVIVGTGVAHLVRHRHRSNPGVPLHALIMHQGREESIIRQQKNLLCFVHHWQQDPTKVYPGEGIMYRCGGAERNVEEEDVFCSSSVYCQWNNNPGVFKRQWFIDEVGERFKKEYEIEYKKYGRKSPFLDFEYYTNWRPYAWTDKNFTVAVGTGLFRHAETEHQYFNTFWYAHYRLTQDLQEIREHYLKNETRFKALGGVHYDPDFPVPSTMMQRYPVDFVRKYQFEDMFTGDLETQRSMINEQYQKYLEKYRVLSEDEWQTTGPDSEKAKKDVNWRHEITSMHHVVEKAMMIAPPEQPHEMSITLVTCLLDIDRSELEHDEYQFRREFKMYLDALEDWLAHKYPKVVYTSEDIANEMMTRMDEETKSTTKFVYTSRKELETKWLGPDNYARVQQIRTSKEWVSRASWLQNSPQAKLKDYNPIVMSKMFMMRDAARQNLWNTTHFLFVDAKHNCRQPKVMTPKNDHIIRAHMFDRLLLTTFDYTPAQEVHGFEYSKFNSYCNLADTSRKQLVKVGRGGIFGGSAFVLEFIAAMYDVALTATLRRGLMGTEENILAILKYQVPQYVDDFSNNWACPDNLKGDHNCKDKNPQGYNCAIFEWVARNAVREETSTN